MGLIKRIQKKTEIYTFNWTKDRNLCYSSGLKTEIYAIKWTKDLQPWLIFFINFEGEHFIDTKLQKSHEKMEKPAVNLFWVSKLRLLLVGAEKELIAIFSQRRTRKSFVLRKKKRRKSNSTIFFLK